MRPVEREIEEFMSRRLERPCMFVPSARLGLYIAMRALLSPGRRILVSPITDDVILFTILAAGLVPVFSPVSPDDGNIDPALVPREVWSSVDGVLTSNLYGLPDHVEDLRARCDRLGIPLVEDAAHAIETRVGGRYIGTFGDVGVWSLSKHVGAGCGGVLAFPDEQARPELERLRDATLAEPGTSARVQRATTQTVSGVVIALHLVWPVRWLRRRLGLVERTGYRMPLRPQALENARRAAPDLDHFDSWIRVDRHDYRMPPSSHELRHALRLLHALDADRGRRQEGVARLAEVPTAAAGVRAGDPQPLFRVPLLVADRAAAMRQLERRVLSIGYIYDPPLNEYAGPAFADTAAVTVEVARWWARHVVAVDPLEADRVLGMGRRARSVADVLSRLPDPAPTAEVADRRTLLGVSR